jgi:dipeptidase
MMEAARTSETLVNFYQTTRYYNPEDSNLHTHRRENLKSYPKEEVSKYRSEFSIESSPPTGVKTPSNSKLIPDWITKLQTPTNKDVTLVPIGSGPGVRY